MNNYKEDLKKASDNLEKITKEYGNYSHLNREIKKLKMKLGKKNKDNINTKDLNKLKEKEKNLQKVLNAEKEIYLIQLKLKKEINKLNKKRNKYDLRKNKLKTKQRKLKKYREIYNNRNYKKDRIDSLNKEIKTFEKQLEKNPKNLAIKVDLFDKYRKRKDINKKIAIANNKNRAKVEKKIKYLSSKLRNIDARKLDQIKSRIDSLLVIYEDSKKETEKGTGVSNSKSFVVENLNVYYGKKQALYNVNIEFPKNKVISIIGPSGCGKSTFLRTLNRINDEISSFRVKGRILLDGKYDIYKLKSIRNNFDRLELTELRTKVGMIFQQPNPFPISIFKNVSYGPRINGYRNKSYLNGLVKKSLISAALWDEVKENIHTIATSLSGGQQQRLCIARAIANKPEILLMDEPTSALDPIAASKIESLILELKKDYTIIMVTHSMQQAARISDYTAFFYNGKLIEFDETKNIFGKPKRRKTEDYIRGRFG